MPPPTRAKSAMDEAPMAKPLMMTGSCQRRKKMPRPRMPSEAMVRPPPAPPKTAPARALSRPTDRAACAVRTLALVAAFMPMNPASMEQTAPEMKASAVRVPMPRASRTATTTMNQTRIEYSLRRNAIAPVSIASAISVMRPLPAGWATTYRYSTKAIRSPRVPRTGARTGRDTGAILDAAGVASFDQPDRLGTRLEAGRPHPPGARGRGGPADPALAPPQLVRAEGADQRPHTVVASRAALRAHPHPAQRQIEVVVHEDEVARDQLELARDARHRRSHGVHEALWFDEVDDVAPPLG